MSFDRRGLFEYTTDPDTGYTELLHPMVFISIIVHSIAYSLTAMLFYFIIYGDLVSWMFIVRFAVFLLVTMPAGYIGRLARAKRLRKIHDIKETKELMRTAYFCWYFLG